MKKNFQTFILLFFFLLLPVNIYATSLLPLDLTELHQQAKDIVVVESTGNTTMQEPETGLIVTYSSFKVIDALKGKVGTIYKLKQIGGTLPDDTGDLKVPGVPTFTVGKKYVLFVSPASKAGFASPVGLGQGKFDILTISNTEMVTNGRDFGDLTNTIPKSSLPVSVRSSLSSMPAPVSADSVQRRTKMSLQNFLSLVRSLK